MTDDVERGAVGPAPGLMSPHYEDVQAVKDEVRRSALEGRDPDFTAFSDVALGGAGISRGGSIISTAPYVDPGLVNEAAVEAYGDQPSTELANKPGGPEVKVAKKAPAKKAVVVKAAPAKKATPTKKAVAK